MRAKGSRKESSLQAVDFREMGASEDEKIQAGRREAKSRASLPGPNGKQEAGMESPNMINIESLRDFKSLR